MKISKYELPDNTTVTIEVQHVYKNKYSACGVGYISIVGKVKDKTYSFYFLGKNPSKIKYFSSVFKRNISLLAFKTAVERQKMLYNFLNEANFIHHYQTSVS